MANNMRYMFIECQTPDEAKLRNVRGSKSAARAHVTKEFHRKVRLQRRETFTAETASQSPTSEPSPPQVDIKEDIVKEEALDDAEEPLDNIPAEDRERSSSVSSGLVSMAVQSLLSQERSDPFDSLPIPDMSPFLHRVLDYAMMNTWPATIPVRGNRPFENPVNAAWLNSAMEYPVLFHAFLYAASLQLLTLRNGKEQCKSDSVLRFDQYQKAVRLINKHISELDGPPPDELILAVTILAVHGSRAEEPAPECHPQSPLATLQYLHVYGQMLAEEKHVGGLKELLQQKGGIEAMDVYGMADAMAL
jgi:hypothetical protein